jgi:hypothetical protein
VSAWEEQFSFPLVPVGVSLAHQPILLDGLTVLFDKKVALLATSLEPAEPSAEDDEDDDE